MSTKMKWLLVPLCSLMLSLPALAADDDDIRNLQSKLGNEWIQVKNDRRQKIKTFVKQEDGKRYRTIKTESLLEGTLETALRVMTDFDQYRRWSWNVRESRLLKQVSPTEYYAYVVHESPPGVPDRDVIFHMVFEPPSPSRPYMVLRTNAAASYIPEKPPMVRMLAEDVFVKLTPQPDNKVLMTMEGYVDPGGTMPPWAINFVSRSAPYVTMLGMRRMMLLDEYINSKKPLPFPVNY
jgi:hypothetical protein